MEIIRTVADMKARAAAWKAAGLSIGLVPTMGSLHEGHESLMDAARAASDRVVVSVFVNPIQFGPGEDYEAYPRDLERDARICERHGVDVVFHPEVDDMYAAAHNTFVVMETLTDSLCGASRPGHFRGVCTVVTKLFNIVQPHRAFFGQKDAQQLAIIKKMVSDLNVPVEVVGRPVVREADGLALSSRNVYLTPEERVQAPQIRKSLEMAAGLAAGRGGLTVTLGAVAAGGQPQSHTGGEQERKRFLHVHCSSSSFSINFSFQDISSVV